MRREFDAAAVLYDLKAHGRLARLAVSLKLQGMGFGGQLLLAAGQRCLQVASQAGGTLMIMNARDGKAAAFHVKFGALPLPDAPLALVLSLSAIADALRASAGISPEPRKQP